MWSGMVQFPVLVPPTVDRSDDWLIVHGDENQLAQEEAELEEKVRTLCSRIDSPFCMCIMFVMTTWLMLHGPTFHSICGNLIIYKPSLKNPFIFYYDESFRAIIDLLPIAALSYQNEKGYAPGWHGLEKFSNGPFGFPGFGVVEAIWGFIT